MTTGPVVVCDQVNSGEVACMETLVRHFQPVEERLQT